MLTFPDLSTIKRHRLYFGVIGTPASSFSPLGAPRQLSSSAVKPDQAVLQALFGGDLSNNAANHTVSMAMVLFEDEMIRDHQMD